MAEHDLVFYERRSTPQVVPKGADAQPKRGYGRQTKRRAATAEEEQVIASGRWLRVDEHGNTPSSTRYKVTQYRQRQGAQRRRTKAKAG